MRFSPTGRQSSGRRWIDRLVSRFSTTEQLCFLHCCREDCRASRRGDAARTARSHTAKTSPRPGAANDGTGSPGVSFRWMMILCSAAQPLDRKFYGALDTRRSQYGEHLRCYAAPSLAAGPSLPRQPERRQLTHDRDQEVAYRQCGHQGHPPPTHTKGLNKSNRPADPRADQTRPLPRLDTSHRQLGGWISVS
jgi:hypothetical protein